MADPSGPQSVIFLRIYDGDNRHVAAHTQACIDYVRERGLPDYIGPFIDEVCDRPVWLTPEGERFLDACRPGDHAIVYGPSAFSRKLADRLPAMRNIVDVGVHLHVVKPIPTEVNHDMLRGMELQMLSMSNRAKGLKSHFCTRWGDKRIRITLDGQEVSRTVENPLEMQITRQLLTRVMLGQDAPAIRKWVREYTLDMRGVRYKGERWGYDEIRSVLRKFGRADILEKFNSTVPVYHYGVQVSG